MERPGARDLTIVLLLVTALVAGALIGLVTASFLWLVQEGWAFLWSDLPDEIGVDAYDSWWLIVLPVVGGALVGLGHLVFGNLPRPIEEIVSTARRGDRIEPGSVPGCFANSTLSLVFAGPVGFEAALAGIIGGGSFWVADRMRGVGSLLRRVWGTEDDALPTTIRHTLYWLAALAGMFTYKWLPFGSIDASFRFAPFDGGLSGREALVGAGFGLVVAIPAAWAVSVVSRAEKATFFTRSPVLVGMAGGLVFALMAIPDQFVLFTGQQAIQNLQGLDTGELLYLGVARWVALSLALFTGWRGGPVFPMWTSVACFALLLDGPLDVRPDVIMVAGIAAVSIVFLQGKLVVGAVLTLYAAPLTYVAVIVVGALGGAVGLALGHALGLLPVAPSDAPPAPAETEVT